MIKKMYCIETDKNTLYVDKDVYDYIVSLEQQCKKQKEAIDKLELENKVLKEQMVAMVKPNYAYGVR